MRRIAILLLGTALGQGTAATVLYETDFSGFRGAGLSPGGAPGQLDSRVWRVRGLSDGEGVFSGTHIGGDFGRGSAAGPVGTGGVYAFDVGASVPDPAFGLQATGGDLSPGTISLLVRNDGTERLEGLELAFDLWVRNDGNRSTALSVLVELDGAVEPLAGAAALTPAAGSAGAGWSHERISVSDASFRLRPGAEALVHWVFDDASGTGSRDEVALDDVRVAALRAAATLGAPPTLPLAALGVLGVAGLGRARRRTAPPRPPAPPS